MLEDISANRGLNHITENILFNLDVQSLWRCQIVCKALHQFIKTLEKSTKLKQKDFKNLRRIRRKKFLVHPNWKALFEAIYEEDNFYRRRGLLELLEAYSQNRILEFNNNLMVDSYLNSVYGTLQRLKFFWPYLLEKNPKVGQYQVTPFHFVAFHGLSDVADFMLEKLQEHCNSRNVNDKSPMNYAIKCGNPEIIRSIQQKITLNSQEIVENLHVAVRNGDFNCVKALLEDQDLESRKEIARIEQEQVESPTNHRNPLISTALSVAKSYYEKTHGAEKARYLQIVEFIEYIF
jgi:predicted Holliday junction resolvase-like endonuclease